MGYWAAPNFARAGVIAGFVLRPAETVEYDTVTTVVGYDPDTGDPIEVTTEVPRRAGSLTPELSTGVLVANGTMWRPGSEPEVLAAPPNALMWLHYSTEDGLYWSNTPLPMEAGDALIGWVRTNASEVIACSSQYVGDRVLEAARVAPVMAAGPQVEAPATFPDAPSPASMTCTISYPADTDNYVASGTVTLDADVEHLQEIVVVGTDGSGRDAVWATLYGPFTASATVDWTSVQLPRPGAAITLTPEAFSRNENSHATRPGATAANVTIAAGGGTSIYTPPTPPDNPLSVTGAEVTSGGRALHTIDLANQLTTCYADVEIELAEGNTAQWFWLSISRDNGTTWGEWRRYPVGSAARVDALAPLVTAGGTANWKARAFTGNSAGGDNTPETAVVSAAFAVHGVLKPLATGCASGSVAAAVNVIDADGAQDWYVPSVAILTPGTADPDAWVVKLTFKCVDASGTAAPAEQGGTEVEFWEWANDGGYHGIDIGSWGYNPAGSEFHYGEIRCYVGRRTAEGESSGFNDGDTHTLQEACWPGGLSYKRFDFGEAPAGELNAARLSESSLGRGLTVRGGALTSDQPGVNRVSNYSWDDGLAHWETYGTDHVPYIDASETVRYRGAYGAAVQGSATATEEVGLRSLEGEAWQVGAGEVWYLRFRYRWLYANGPVKCKVLWLDKYYAPVSADVVTLTPEAESVWRVSGPMRLTAPAGASWARVAVLVREAGSGFTSGWWAVDDVECWRASDATAVDPATLGNGLTTSGGALVLKAGDGVGFDGSGNVKVKLGSGVTLTPDGKVKVHIAGGASIGLDPDEALIIQTGAGIETDEYGDLVVTPGAGVSFDGAGNVIVKTGAGVGIDGSGNVQVKLGAGVTVDSGGNVAVKTSATIGIGADGNLTVAGLPRVAGLPGLPNGYYPAGSAIINTLDSKVYRTANGVTWLRSTDPADLVAGAIASGVTIAAAQVNAGTFNGFTFTGSTMTLSMNGITATVNNAYDAVAGEYLGLKVRNDGAGHYAGYSDWGVSLVSQVSVGCGSLRQFWNSAGGYGYGRLYLTATNGAHSIAVSAATGNVVIDGYQVLRGRLAAIGTYGGSPGPAYTSTEQAIIAALVAKVNAIVNALGGTYGHGLTGD